MGFFQETLKKVILIIPDHKTICSIKQYVAQNNMEDKII